MKTLYQQVVEAGTEKSLIEQMQDLATRFEGFRKEVNGIKMPSIEGRPGIKNWTNTMSGISHEAERIYKMASELTKRGYNKEKPSLS
jgi:hypothetical protein